MRRGQSGYTLIEILTVIAIIVLLALLLVTTVQGLKDRAKREATNALIGQIDMALQNYHQAFGGYPPDRVTLDDGRELCGSQCLVYFLGRPLDQVSVTGSETAVRHLDPAFEGGFRDVQLSGPLAGANWDEVEIIDAWGRPIHYDNTQETADDQSDAPDWHLARFAGGGSEQFHGPDPRRDAASGEVRARNAGSYDVWSHGPDPSDPSDDLQR